MKKKAIRKSKVARLTKQPVVRKPIRKKAATRKRIPIRKAAVEPSEISSNAGALESLPEVTNADGEAAVDVVEVVELGVY